jgi:hypothetical protein
MPKTSVRILYNRFPELARRLPAVALDVAEETVREIDEMVKREMAASGGGRTYTRGGRSHTASVPGAFPAIDTGALAGSMKYQIARGTYTVRYYSDDPKAAYLEYGTSKLLARPFLTPAAERNRKVFLNKMKNLEDRLR